MKTIQELNAIQTQWMDLDSNAPQSEIDRVIALMNTTPKSHITGNSESGFNVLHGQSTPQFARPVTIEQAKECAEKYGYRTDVSFSNKWISI
jgi:hypothetical protein